MPIAVTKQGELVAEINSYLLAARSYASPGDFWFKRIAFQAKKLLGANASEGHYVLSQLYGAAGDREESLKEWDIAQKFSNDASLWTNKAVLLSNLGYFSEAQGVYAEGAAPEYGQFPHRLGLGLCIGAVHKAAEFAIRAQQLKLELDEEQVRLIERVAVLMDEFSLSDARLGSMLDVAGGILREEKMFFMGAGPEILPGDRDSLERFIAINFRLPVSGNRAAELDLKLGHRLWDEIVDVPFEIMLHFESGLPLNERFPERASISS